MNLLFFVGITKKYSFSRIKIVFAQLFMQLLAVFAHFLAQHGSFSTQAVPGSALDELKMFRENSLSAKKEPKMFKKTRSFCKNHVKFVTLGIRTHENALCHSKFASGATYRNILKSVKSLVSRVLL